MPFTEKRENWALRRKAIVKNVCPLIKFDKLIEIWHRRENRQKKNQPTNNH